MTKTKKITSLTKEQIDMLPTIRDEWIAHGLCTKPSDRKTTEEYVDAAYREAGLEAPKAKVWFDSPLAGCLAVEMLIHAEKLFQTEESKESFKEFIDDEVYTEVRTEARSSKSRPIYEGVIDGLLAMRGMMNALAEEIQDITHDEIDGGCEAVQAFFKKEMMNNKDEIVQKAKSQVSNAIYGQHDAGWLSFYDAMGRFGVEAANRLKPLMKIAQSCGWWWAFEEIAIFTERPTEIHLDENGRLHHEEKAALAYPDGFAIYAVHGVRLPAYVITDPERITVKGIKAERNAEIKRIMRERYGTGRYLQDIGAKVIHADTTPVDALVPKGKAIHRALIEDDEKNRYLVGSDGSTGRVYYMRVPSDVETCKAAYEALSGRPGVRTITEA